MGIGELLTIEEKIISLGKIKSSLSMEIYKMCVHLGVDPDTFDYSTFTCPEGNIIDGRMEIQLPTLERHCKNLVNVISKLEALENA